jgi:hypothetical protein
MCLVVFPLSYWNEYRWKYTPNYVKIVACQKNWFVIIDIQRQSEIMQKILSSVTAPNAYRKQMCTLYHAFDVLLFVLFSLNKIQRNILYFQYRFSVSSLKVCIHINFMKSMVVYTDLFWTKSKALYLNIYFYW